MRRLALSLFAVAVASSSAPAQSPQPLRTTTAGVLIDVAILDRDGQPVIDLSLDDFEVNEGGKRQQLTSVSLVQGGTVRPVAGGPATAAQPGPGSASANPEPAAASAQATASVTAILFDRLSPEVRPLARQAALTLVSTLNGEHDYAGVFLADAKLATFAPFTTQTAALRAAIDRASAVATGKPGAPLAASALSRGLPVDRNQPATPGAESASSGWVNAAEREKALNASGPDGMLRRMEVRMSEGYEQFISEYEGQTSFAGLRAVVDALAPLPGRKSVMYFAESLPITGRLKSKFEDLIGLANRRNITIYPVDAAGLRVHSTQKEVSRNLEVAGGQGVGDVKREGGAYTKDLENQEQVLTSGPSAALSRLAKETGGFLLENTNNLAAGVARMQQERTTYYLLAYQPINTAADGKFRRVDVKVKRPRVTVRARTGYTAPTSGQ